MRRRGHESDHGIPGLAFQGDRRSHQGRRRHGTLSTRRLLLFHAYGERPAVSDLSAKERVADCSRGSDRGLERAGKHQSFMALGAFAPSDDGRLLAYSTDATGYRQYTLHVKDLSTGMLLPDTAEHVGGIVWTTDNRTLFFTTEDAVTKRSDKFFRHELGSPRTDLVYEEKDELFDIAVRRSRRHLSRERLQDLHGVRVSPANKPTAPLEFDQKSTNLSCPSTSSRTGNRCCSRVLRA
jgi:hypothetical protein